MKTFTEWLMSERNQMAAVYHVSPVSDLVKLRPTGFHKGVQAHPQHQEGVYVAPRFQDAVAWAASFVIHQKDKTQERKRTERDYKTDQQGMHKEPMKYKNLTIYKLKVPKEILKNSWRSNSWEPEHFITDVSAIQIVSSQTYTKDEIFTMYGRQTRMRSELHDRDPDKIATRLRGNYAAKEYLRLKEAMRQKAMKSEVSPKTLDEFRLKMKYLVPYFWGNTDPWEKSEPLAQVEPAKLPKAQQLVTALNWLLTQP